MKRRFSLMMAVVMMAVMIVLGFGMIGLTAAQDDEGPMSSLRFVVVRDSDGKPVRNAQVVLHPVGHKGKQAQGEIDLKTNADGKTSVDGIPMVRCGCRCWRRISRPSEKTTRSTSRRWNLR